MQSFRRYNLLFAAMLGPVVAVMVAASFFLQPYDGDLTRIGGYAESDFGWQSPQKRFVPPLFRTLGSAGAQFIEPADVLILGDSFTFQAPQMSWPNYLARATGLRVHAFKIEEMTPDRLLQSELYRRHPPRVVIYQTVERSVRNRLQTTDASCRAARDPAPARLALRPLAIEPESFQRPTRATALDLSMSVDFLAKAVPRALFGRDKTRTRRLALLHRAPFSSTAKDHLLVYKDDLEKTLWTASDWESVRCRLIELQNRVQANGQTYFIAMIAPDKLGAYDDLLADRSLAGLSHIEWLARDPALHLPRIDLALRRAIRDGVTDVYLSNDTHWGSAGYDIAAHAVVAQLTRAGVLAPATAR
ncbi:MAG TPA: hypothetical protein VJ396_07130 [Acidiferrobacterales bacterium]|nr:hypothetical protein [Acidiferrobacterales bacterium]